MSDLIETSFKVNGKDITLKSDPDRSVLEVLREDLQLTGTKYGCGEGACGACTVLVDGKPKFSCSTLVSEIVGKKITTIEGLAPEGKLHPVQQSFLACESFQCGYCTAGMMMAAAELLDRVKKPTDEEIVKAMNGHLCRCGTYPRIIEAIHQASKLKAV